MRWPSNVWQALLDGDGPLEAKRVEWEAFGGHAGEQSHCAQ